MKFETRITYHGVAIEVNNALIHQLIEKSKFLVAKLETLSSEEKK